MKLDKRLRNLLFCILLGTIYIPCYSQSDDSLSKVVEAFPSPPSVAIRSAIIPGWGQIVNKQWYKAPIIYAGMGVTIGFVVVNHRDYKRFQKANRIRRDGDSSTYDEFDVTNPKGFTYGLSETNLISSREDAKRLRDLSYIILGGIYLANILDAYVFAHLRAFDISDDLSFRVMPPTLGWKQGGGLGGVLFSGQLNF